MERTEFALLSKRARKYEMIISVSSSILAVVALMLVYILNKSEKSSILISILAIFVFMIIATIGQYIASKLLVHMGHVCIVCNAPIKANVAKQFIMSGICPECGERNFPNA